MWNQMVLKIRLCFILLVYINCIKFNVFISQTMLRVIWQLMFSHPVYTEEQNSEASVEITEVELEKCKYVYEVQSSEITY